MIYVSPCSFECYEVFQDDNNESGLLLHNSWHIIITYHTKPKHNYTYHRLYTYLHVQRERNVEDSVYLPHHYMHTHYNSQNRIVSSYFMFF
jgi:hypothetical protein